MRKYELSCNAVVLRCFVLFIICYGTACLPYKSLETSPRMRSLNRMKNVALALHNYHNHYGSYPPAWVADENGKPLYSWRVLLLPFLDERPLYDSFRLDKPWDSPHNLNLSLTDLRIYQSPDNKHGPGTTNYVAILGVGPWQGADALSEYELTGNRATSLMFVEQHGEKIHWAEPRDLDISTLPLRINDRSGRGIGSPKGGKAVVAFRDGRAKFVDESLERDNLVKMLGGPTGKPLRKK